MIVFKCTYELLCLIFLSCQIFQADAGYSNFYSDIKSHLLNSKTYISDLYVKFKVSVPTLKSLSVYSEKLNIFTSVADNLVTGFVNNLKLLIHNYDDYLTPFAENGSLWRSWPLKKFRKNPCSNFNVTAFDLMIENELYGQPLVNVAISQYFKTHLSTEKPKKLLMMSFNGLTGSGKSFLCKIIADSLYLDGMSSKCVHIYHGNLDFPYEDKKEAYRKRLLYEISLSTHICERSLFIFDEVDKMIPGVIDILIPYLKFDERGSGIDFKKSVFIFLSNTGGNRISQITYDTWLDGLSREDLSLEDFSSYLKEAVYNFPNGLQFSEIVDQDLINVFVPFLPLEKEHIKKCIIRELKLRKLPYHADVVEEVASQFVYYPPEFEVFSVSGCKKVSHKVDLYGDNNF